jgi:hypothetical protein
MRFRVPGRVRSRAPEAAAASATLQTTEAETITLIYELLDAHQDTAEMAERLCEDPMWGAHLDYLRALQRIGREMLARMPADEDARVPADEDGR